MPGDDRKTRTRFDAVMEEIDGPPAPLAGPDPDRTVFGRASAEQDALDALSLVWNGSAIACPRCALSAFELLSTSTDRPLAACLGCPAPAPVYALAPGVTLDSRVYRCSRCGRRSPVTMELNDVNLHCRGCGVLTLHEREPRVQRTTSYTRVTLKRTSGGWTAAMTEDDDDEALAEALVGEVDERTALRVDQLRRELDLEPFEEHARRRRAFNERTGVIKDVERRTGRTVHGILKALVSCRERETTVLLVKALNPRYERTLCRQVADTRDRLSLQYPKTIEPYSEARNRGFRVLPELETFVDHTAR